MTGRALSTLRHSTTGRFVALHIALSLIATLPVFLFIYVSTHRLVLTEIQAIVEEERLALVENYQEGQSDGLVRAIEAKLSSGAAVESVFLLASPAGEALAGNLDAWPPTLQVPSSWREMSLYRSGHAQAEQTGVIAHRLPSGERLLVGRVLDDPRRLQRALIYALAGALLLALPIGFLGSLVLVRFMNNRVRAVALVAEGVAKGQLADRIPAYGTNDPFDQLARALNAMLARIEGLVEELRMVTDGLAHDLRSPLMRIRAWLEKADAKESGESRGQAIEAVSREVETMLRMISGTLEITRAEAGMGRESFTSFDLAELIHDLCEMYQPLAEDHGISIVTEKPGAISFFGNRELIGQAVSNLVDNAIKYAAGGRAIGMGVTDDDGTIRIWVADRGAGIPLDRREEAIRKFRRLDDARATDGSGLGLALVRAVASLHDGELRLEDNDPGLRAVMVLPLA